MSYHPRIESREHFSFITSRCRNSELWFANNKKLETKILTATAKYSNRYNISLYAFCIEGNHIHQLIHTPDCNRSKYLRDQNSTIARAVPYYVPNYNGGKLWGRRFSSDLVYDNGQDLENWFFYTVLQPVKDGLVDNIFNYREYNCFMDAVSGKKRIFKEVNWKAFNLAKKKNPKAKPKDYLETYTLEYKRIPGYEHLTQAEYKQRMKQELYRRQNALVKAKREKGEDFLGVNRLKQVVPGSLPNNSKTSERYTRRPRVLSVCALRRQQLLDFYFDCLLKYRRASSEYRAGNLNVEFPPGMYKPYLDPPRI